MPPKAKAVIMTVGLSTEPGRDVLDVLELDLRELEPEYLAVIASDASRANGRRLIERSGLSADRAEIVEVSDARDLDDIFRKTNELIQRLVEQGYAPDQIAVNYTAGTKVMGSGAVLSAVYNKVMELRYITGLTAPGDRAQPVRHRIVTTRPGAVFAYQDLLTGRNMLLDLRYRSALDVLAGIDEEFLSPSDRQQLAALMKLTRAYDAWDNFQYGQFLLRYEEITFNGENLRAFRLEATQHELVRRVAHETAARNIGPHIIAEMFNNAERRLMVGRIEDAMARLYRCLELLAQWVLLREYGIDTNDVDTRRVPPRDRVALEALRSLEDGMVKIGLRKSFDLLRILGARVGQVLEQDPVLRQFLELRSGSILAHGLQPVARGDGERFMTHAREVFRIEIEQFDELTRQMQFPWLRDRPREAGPDQVRGE